MSSNILVNDLFDDLSHNLNVCRKLVRKLWELREKCFCVRELDEECESLLREFRELNAEKENANEVKDNAIRGKGFRFENQRLVCNSRDLHFRRKSEIERRVLSHSQKSVECEVCGKAFAQKRLLQSHALRTHATIEEYCVQIEDEEEVIVRRNHNNRYECSHCEQHFISGSHLRRHLKSHKKHLKCLKCDKRFAQKSNARDHYARVHQKRVLSEQTTVEIASNQCLWIGCGKVFASKSLLRKHETIHSGEKPFSCLKCGKSFRQKSSLEVHEMHVHGEHEIPETKATTATISSVTCGPTQKFFHNGSDFICELCAKSFASFYHMKRHLFTHQTVKPFECPHESCSRTFGQKTNLLSHYIRVHKMCGKTNHSFRAHKRKSSEPKERFACSQCPRVFQNPSLLAKHQKRVHDSRNPLECSFSGCEARFRDGSHWEQHVRRHARTHSCTFQGCDYRTHSESTLKVHVSKHTGQELFKCEICDKGFDYLGSLGSHKRKEHRIELPLVCEWPGCGNAYKTVAGIKKHQTLHTGETKYGCSWPECGMRFRALPQLKVHSNKHTEQRVHKCQLCERSYFSQEVLRSHYLKCHKRPIKVKK